MHRAAALLAAFLVTVTALSACTDGRGDRPEPSSTRSPEALPGAPASGRTPSGAASASTSARPEFRGRQELVVRTGREVFVQPSCTPDVDGNRPCWRETALPYDLTGAPAAVTVTAARTDLDSLTDSWFVELTVADEDVATLARALEQAGGAGAGTRLALATPDGALLALASTDAEVDGDRLRLPGLDKADAWSLVADVVRLGGG